VVPAGEEPGPDDPVAARYWGELDPVGATMSLYRLHPGNVIYRGQDVEEVTYNYGNTVSLTMQTPQAQVTFVDGTVPASPVCYQGGAVHTPCPDPSWPAPCRANFAFCGPINATNTGSSTLPDPLIEITGQRTNNTVKTCGNVNNGQCGTSSDKVAALAGTTPAPISTSCVYCYGNAVAVSNECAPGLVSGMRPNESLTDVNSNLFVLNLTNHQSTGVTFTARYAAPKLETTSGFNSIPLKQCSSASTCSNFFPPLCSGSFTFGLTPLTNSVKITGSGFGPPGECSGTPTCSSTWCPTTGSKFPAGASISFGTGHTVSAAQLLSWSDTQIWAIVPSGAVDGPITVTTAFGSIATASVNICP
jgi:hypothetical protein